MADLTRRFSLAVSNRRGESERSPPRLDKSIERWPSERLSAGALSSSLGFHTKHTVLFARSDRTTTDTIDTSASFARIQAGFSRPP